MPDKIMASVEPADVATMAMIEAMRAIADGQKAMQAEIKSLDTKVDDVRDRVVRIEAIAVDQRVTELDAKVDLLMADKAGRDSVSRFAEAVRRWMPSMVAVVFVIILFLRATGRLGE